MATKQMLDCMQIEKLKTELGDAPVPARKLTVKETVMALVPSLRDAQARGHTIESLVAVLAGQGLTISARSLGQITRVKTATVMPVATRKKVH